MAKLLHAQDKKTEAVIRLWELTRVQMREPRATGGDIFASKVFLKLANWYDLIGFPIVPRILIFSLVHIHRLHQDRGSVDASALQSQMILKASTSQVLL